MNRLITSWTENFPVVTPAFALPEGLAGTVGGWADLERDALRDIQAAKKTERLYREKGRRAFKPLAGYRTGLEK